VNAAAASLPGEGANDLDCTTAGADLHGRHGNAGRPHGRHGNAGRLALPPRQRRR
jgi:hypothetical protein